MSRKQRIYDVLSTQIKPITLLVDDESHRHNVPPNAQTHYKVVAVASLFENLSRVARHRLINNALADEFIDGLHALSLHLYTPNEWIEKTAGAPASPVCRNGKHQD